MKKSGLLVVLWSALLCPVSAQVTVEVALDQDEFLPGEPLPAAVRITNRSGQTLHLGKDQDWLTFTVESREGYVVLKTGELPVVGEFTVESSMRAIKRVDLAPCFNMVKPGRYMITATVNIQDWNRQLTSSPKGLDIIEGAKLWEKEFGVPNVNTASNAAPEVRKYTLQQANYLRHNLMLYFRLTDGTGKLNKVFPIGPILSFGKPEPQVDKASNLHVLYQNGPRSFNYTIINPDGNVIGRQTYDYTTRPRMQADPDGNFRVVGGRRRMTSNDLPEAGTVQTNGVAAIPSP